MDKLKIDSDQQTLMYLLVLKVSISFFQVGALWEVKHH